MKKLSTHVVFSTLAFVGLISSAMASPSLVSSQYGIVVKNDNAGAPLKTLTIEFGTPTTESGNITDTMLNPQLSAGITVNTNEENKKYLTNFATIEADSPILPSGVNGTISIPLSFYAITAEGVKDSYTGGKLVITVSHGITSSNLSPGNTIEGKNGQFFCEFTPVAASGSLPAYGLIDCVGP